MYQILSSQELSNKNVKLAVKREDLIHPILSGNKWRKLKYNIEQAKIRGNDTLLTFGGAYSNHIQAVALAGKEYGFNTLGIIRGDELSSLNVTLREAKKNGMTFHFMDRDTYRLKDTYDVKEYLREHYGKFYLIPEGGSNFYGTNGCMEILDSESKNFDIICCPAGTGCTAAGLALSMESHQQLWIFSALKGDFIQNEVEKYIVEVVGDTELVEGILNRVTFIKGYDFGGYAKFNDELIQFLKNFYDQHNIKWDAIYNGKMAYGVFDMIHTNLIGANKSILLIHTGGIQGLKGIEERFGVEVYC